MTTLHTLKFHPYEYANLLNEIALERMNGHNAILVLHNVVFIKALKYIVIKNIIHVVQWSLQHDVIYLTFFILSDLLVRSFLDLINNGII